MKCTGCGDPLHLLGGDGPLSNAYTCDTPDCPGDLARCEQAGED